MDFILIESPSPSRLPSNFSHLPQYTCNERNLDDFLACPNDFNALVNEHWLIYLWESSGLSQDRLLFAIKGLLIGLIQGLSFLYLMTYYEYGDHGSSTTTTTLTKTADGKSTERSSCNN